jgi:osmotically-inducible protein OsmY
MRSDTHIKADVEAELSWSPDLDETDVAIKVQDGVVLLSGYVHSYFEKDRAEAAAKRVKGVCGVANDVIVRLAIGAGTSDPEIARAAVAALKATAPQLADRLKVIVSQGHLTLEGAVQWNFQKSQAEIAVRNLAGVTGLTDLIHITPQVAPIEIERRIHDAFRRSADVDAERVCVATHDGEVTLKGTVSSWSEREEAQRTAWSAPGVTAVKNDLKVVA